jgi:hypothetical protein
VHHGKGGPWWLAVLVAAESWGCPPWEIAGGGRLMWWFRWQAYQKHLAKAQEVRHGK